MGRLRVRLIARLAGPGLQRGIDQLPHRAVRLQRRPEAEGLTGWAVGCRGQGFRQAQIARQRRSPAMRTNRGSGGWPGFPCSATAARGDLGELTSLS